jgi:dihydrodipicolinate synthase/N-acetylneuraminate lyase
MRVLAGLAAGAEGVILGLGNRMPAHGVSR